MYVRKISRVLNVVRVVREAIRKTNTAARWNGKVRSGAGVAYIYTIRLTAGRDVTAQTLRAIRTLRTF